MNYKKKIFIFFITLVILPLFLPPFSKSSEVSTCQFYKWYDPNTNDPEAKSILKNCASCHMAYYKEWISDKHSMSQNNPFFLSIYTGIEAGTKENIYPAFKLDHPKQNGNCILCHNPEAALDNNFDIDLRTVKNTNGISCNFCHKIEKVDNNSLLQGVRGLTVPRVCQGQKDIGFGPLNDLIESSDIVEFKYSPLYKQSLYCAKCHDGFQGNTQIYSTFTEWLNSPANKKNIQCQSCHMPPREKTSIRKIHIVDNPSVKSKLRPYHQVHNHSFLTNSPHEFRKRFIDLKIKAKIKNNILKITTTVENKNPGHSFPTGSTMRNVVLVIEVKDKNKNVLKQTKGLKLPTYAGSLKDKPGKLFAKILSETSSQYAQTHGELGIKFRKIAEGLGIPAQQWWNIFISSDTRIKALMKDISRYEFAVKPDQAIDITVKLIWRNTWPGLAKIKGFELKEDLLVEKKLFL